MKKTTMIMAASLMAAGIFGAFSVSAEAEKSEGVMT